MSAERASLGEPQLTQNYDLTVFGRVRRSPDWWLDWCPGILDRQWSSAEMRPHEEQVEGRFRAFSLYTFYALNGYSVGIRDLTQAYQLQGLTRDQILEGLGIAFIHGGPRGMETIADALRNFQWRDPEHPAGFPDGWGVDPDAFRSGVDYSIRILTTDDTRKIEAWYERWLGEVPRYVRFLARHRPRTLKTYRYRYENLIRVLPKQVLPMTLLSYEVTRGFEPGIRENVLLAKGFGVSKRDLLGEIQQALVIAGMEGTDAVDRAVGDVFEEWV